MRAIRRTMAILAVIALLPLFAVLLTATVAGIAGCEVNEAGPMPCMVFGTDIGGVLSGLMITGWFSLLTIPALMTLAGIWALLEAYTWNRRRRKAKRQLRQASA